MRTPTRQDSLSSLDRYLSGIDRYHLMSPAQELRLSRRYHRTGDRRAARILITRNLRFVVKVAAEFRSYGFPLNDLIQEGNMGLMHAVEKFDPEKGNRLITYAVWWIRAYIQEYVLRSWSMVRLGTTHAQRKLFFSLARTKRELARSQTDGESPTPAAVAQRLGVTAPEVISMEQRLDGRDVSLDAPHPNQESGAPVESLASGAPPADEALEDAEERELIARHVQRALGRLDPRERYIIERRCLDEKPRRFEELGEKFDFSRERARQLEVRAKGKLRAELHGLAGGYLHSRLEWKPMIQEACHAEALDYSGTDRAGPPLPSGRRHQARGR